MPETIARFPFATVTEAPRADGRGIEFVVHDLTRAIVATSANRGTAMRRAAEVRPVEGPPLEVKVGTTRYLFAPKLPAAERRKAIRAAEASHARQERRWTLDRMHPTSARVLTRSEAVSAPMPRAPRPPARLTPTPKPRASTSRGESTPKPQRLGGYAVDLAASKAEYLVMPGEEARVQLTVARSASKSKFIRSSIERGVIACVEPAPRFVRRTPTPPTEQENPTMAEVTESTDTDDATMAAELEAANARIAELEEQCAFLLRAARTFAAGNL